MDSDALFHQFDIRLANVMDVQLLDVASRRAIGQMIDRVPGIAKTTSTHMTAAETAVAEDLKVRVKKLYAVEESDLWAVRPLTTDARRYAALDVWLLIKLYQKLKFDFRDDKDDWIPRTLQASAARVLEFRELKIAVQQGVFTEESTMAPTFWYVLVSPCLCFAIDVTVPMMSTIA
jgi:exonuclease 3'-5' domain-containing protein 1